MANTPIAWKTEGRNGRGLCSLANCIISKDHDLAFYQLLYNCTRLQDCGNPVALTSAQSSPSTVRRTAIDIVTKPRSTVTVNSRKGDLHPTQH